MDRIERIDNLISTLQGIIPKAERRHLESNLAILRQFAGEVPDDVSENRLKAAVDSLQVAEFLKPVILAEMTKINNATAPQLLSTGSCGEDTDCQKFVEKIAIRKVPFAA